MKTGTNRRTHEAPMRQGIFPGFATVDHATSRRSTVMRALHQATGVIREYQSDSSSKSPVSSVSFDSEMTNQENWVM